MYKHLADSILESDEKIFISQADKDKYDNYENVFIPKEDTYSREEIEEYTKELDDISIPFEGTHINVENSRGGIADISEILGETKHKYDVFFVRPTLIPGSINTNGSDNNGSPETTVRTDYHQVNEKDIIVYMNGSRPVNVFFYDANKSFMSLLNHHKDEIEVPKGCKYVRFYTNADNTDNIYFLIKRVDLDELLVVKDEINIRAVGKNLFDPNSEVVYKNGITDTIVEEDSITVSSNRLAGANYVMFKPIKLAVGKKYTISCKDMEILNGGEEVNTRIRIATVVKNLADNSICYVTIAKGSGKNPFEFTVEKGMEYISIGLYTQTSATSTTEYKRVRYNGLMLRESSNNDEYEKFINSEKTIELPEGIELYSVNDSKDRIFKREDGVWCLEKNTISITLDGSEKWVKHSSTLENTQSFYLNLPSQYGISFPEIWKDKLIASRFNLISGISVIDEEGINLSNSTNNNLWLRVNFSKATNETELSKYLSRNNIEVKIVNPYPEIIELDSFNHVSIQSLPGVNNIITNTNKDISPLIKGSFPVSIGASIKSTNMIIDDIDNKIYDVKTMKQASSIQYESYDKVIPLSETKTGTIDDIKIYGNTLYNHAIGSFTKNQTYQYEGTLGEDGVPNEQLDCLYREYIDTFLPKKTYTVVVDVLENTISDSQKFILVDATSEGELIAENKVYIPSGFTGRFVSTFKTIADISKPFKSYLRTYPGDINHGSIKLGKYVIVEGDFTDKPLEYFEGILSVNDRENNRLSIQSRNDSKNILNVQDLHNGTNTIVKNGLVYFSNTDGNTNISGFAYIPVEKGQKYYIKIANIETLDASHYGIVAVRDGDMSSDQSTTFISMKGYVGGRTYEIIPKHNMLRLYLTTENQKTIGNFTYKISVTKSENNNYDYEVDRQEIVMIKDMVNIYDGYNESGDMNWSNGTDEVNNLRTRSGYIDIEGKVTIKFNTAPARVIFYDKDKNFISAENLKTEYRVPENAKFIRFSVINDSYTIENMRLQAFSPIILRSVKNGTCDTIEKHNDGKYYYHKRCSEVTADGTGAWYGGSNGGNEQANTHRFYLSLDNYDGVATVPHRCTTNYPCTGYTTYDSDDLGVQISETDGIINLRVNKTKVPDVETLKTKLNNNPITIVYVLKTEEVYELSPLDLISYDGETSVVFDTIIPTNKSFNVSSGISSVINSVKYKISNLESIINEQNISQNKFILTNTYVADKTTLKVDIVTANTRINNVDEDIFTLIYKNIIVGEDNYNRMEMEEIIDFYTMVGSLCFDMAGILFDLIEKQHSCI